VGSPLRYVTSPPDDQVVHDTIVARADAPGAGSCRLPTV
jgi:hypothetical protein